MLFLLFIQLNVKVQFMYSSNLKRQYLARREFPSQRIKYIYVLFIFQESNEDLAIGDHIYIYMYNYICLTF